MHKNLEFDYHEEKEKGRFEMNLFGNCVLIS